jgi:Ca-activated chloride channel homolog
MSSEIRREQRKFRSDQLNIRTLLAVAVIVGGIVFVPLNAPSQPLANSTPTPGEVLCAPNAIQISIAYMPLTDPYMPQVMADFNRAYLNGADPITGEPLKVGERPICITGKEGSSGPVMQGIVNAVIAPNNQNVERPTIFQPAVSHWLTLTNYHARRQLFLAEDIKPVAMSPVVIAIWESRLNAIRKKVGYDNIGWQELVDVLYSPNGWLDYGIPIDRRAVYYGHTDPYISSTGLSTLIAEFYASARRHGDLGGTLTLDVVNKPEVKQGVRDIEKLIRHYSPRTTEFKFYIAQGPDYVDFVALPENDLIYINTREKPPEKLVALYPTEGTFWHEHPFGIVHADWTTEEQREAARVFTRYVLTPPVQRLIMSRGFRPANPDVPLEAPVVPESGIDPKGPAATLPVPPVETINAIQQSWLLVKKQADILLVVDVSGSMAEEGRLNQAKKAMAAFLDRVELRNRVGLLTFSDSIQVSVPIGNFETNRDQIQTAIESLQPEGGTELYAAVQQSVSLMNRDEQKDRIRVIVLLSDGQDTGARGITLNDAVQAITASYDSLNPVIVIPVAYGSDADFNALNTLARTSKTALQFGEPRTILNVLQVIASFG